MLHPSSVQVFTAWLATLPGLSASMVATTLPKDPATWEANGFITATVAGGSMGVDVPLRDPLIQVDAWACKANTARPPWGKAHALAELVINSGWARGQRADVTYRDGYYPARVSAVWAVSEPLPLYDDASSYARVRVDFRLTWMELAVT